MHLKRLHVFNVRNIADQEVEFSPGFNYLSGDNGAGKTALLEAIHLLARGRSFRTHRIGPVIQHAQTALVVTGEVVLESGGRQTLGTQRNLDGSTELRLGQDKTVKVSALAQVLPVQTLLPDAAELVLGAPGLRRTFLDWGLFHVEPSFLSVSSQYRRVLSQRNAWLKQNSAKSPPLKEDPWFKQYRQFALQISTSRERYVAALRPSFDTFMKSLNADLDVQISYDWGGLVSADQADKKVSESYPRDVKLGATQRGPHRGDLLFIANGNPAAEVASRGQAKLVASAALMAQAKLLSEQGGQRLVFLIDDFGAELDQSHWQMLVTTLLTLNCQVIATSTEKLDLETGWVKRLPDLRVFHVEQGRVNPISITQ